MTRVIVTRGLDPRVHLLRKKMDCRVKPGNDEPSQCKRNMLYIERAMIETVQLAERIRKPLCKKLNPMWWFGNEGEQTVDEAPWYMPHKPWILRYIFWNFFRNPMMNFRNYVIGVGDRTYTVVGKVPAMCIQRDDLDPPELGWQWSFIRLRWLLLPFVSYCGRKFVMQLGWQPFGYAEIKLNWRKPGGYNPGVSECDRAAVNRGS